MSTDLAIRKNMQVSLVALTLLLTLIGQSLLYPIWSALYLEFFNGDSSAAARLNGGILSVRSLIQLFSLPILGAMSDVYGRKFVLIVSLFIGLVEYSVLAFYSELSAICITRTLNAFMDATTVIPYALFTDLAKVMESNGENRLTYNMGLAGAAFGGSLLIGPLVGGGLYQMFGSSAAFAASGSITLFNLLLIVVFLEESLQRENRQKLTKEACLRLSILQGIRIFAQDQNLKWLAGAYFLCCFSSGVYGIWYIYVGEVLHMSILDAAYLLTGVGFTSVLMHTCGLRLLVPRVWSQYQAIVYGTFVHAVQVVLFGFMRSGLAFYFVHMATSMGTLADPTLRTAIAQRVSLSDQGLLNGALASLATLSAVFAAPIFAEIFAVGLKQGIPGSPFFFAAVLYFIGSAVSTQYQPIQKATHHELVDNSMHRTSQSTAPLDIGIELGRKKESNYFEEEVLLE